MHKFKIYIYILFIISVLTAQNVVNPDSLYKSGNDAMMLENYSIAIKAYEELLAQDYHHADLYHNLGNAYFRLNQIGNAIWAYEKGLQLVPRDKDLKFNLSLANTRVRDRIELPQATLFLEQYRAFKNSTTFQDIILIAAAIFMLGTFIYFLKKYYGWQSIWISRLVITLFTLSVFAHLIAWDKYFEISDTKEVIITQNEVEIYSAPFDRRESVLFRLHEGVKAEVTQDQQNWLEIELIDGKKGWIQSDKVRKL
jgi:tetratricopeptide (TPR) repeat protein